MDNRSSASRSGRSLGSQLQLAATCAFGLESVVARELTDLGAPEVRAENGAVTFAGGLDMLVKANMWLRCADRVWVRLARFKALTFEDLFQGVKGLPWPELLGRDAAFPVEGSSHESQLSSVPACQAVTKKAIVESLKRAYKTDWFDERGPQFKVRVSLVRDEVTISLDSSGSGLARTLGTRLDKVDALLARTAAKRAEAVAARTLSAFASRADSASAPPRRRGAFWKVRPAAAAEPLALAPSPAALPLVAAPRSQAVGGSVVVLWNGRQLAPDEVAMLEALAAPLVAYLSSPPSPPAERAGAAPSRRPKPSKESRR